MSAVLEAPLAKQKHDHQIDVQWFRYRLEALKMTYEAVGKYFDPPLDKSAVTRILNGQRRIKIEETSVFAMLFGVDRETVQAKAGFPPVAHPTTHVHIAGSMDVTGAISYTNVRGPRRARRPLGVSAQGEAFRYQVADPRDGWLVFAEPAQPAVSGSTAGIGRLCIVEDDVGREKLRYVLRQEGPSEWKTSTTADGDGIIEKLISMRPVIWIQCYA